MKSGKWRRGFGMGAIGAAAAAGAGGTLLAATINVNSTKDNTLIENSLGTVSNGAGPGFFVGRTSFSGVRRGLIQFDLHSLIPAGATVNSVSLTLNLNKSNVVSNSIELHRMAADWGEGTSNSGSLSGGSGAPATPGDATWLNTFFNTGTWSAAGGDFSSTISASASIAALGPVTVASTPQLVADVQGWVDSPSGNFGWAVLGNETAPGSAMRFDTRESTTGPAPRLSIDFTAATPSGSTWNVDGDGNWSEASNWQGGVPNAPGATANFGTKISAGVTVTVDAPQTVGVVNFSSPNTYTVAGSSTLTLDGGSGSTSINVTAGSPVISAPIVLAKDTTIAVSGGGNLSVAHVRGAGLSITSGGMKVLANGSANSAAGTSKVTSLAIASGASLDLTNNSAVIDYSGSAGTLVDDVRQMIGGGKLMSSSADAMKNLGYSDNAALGMTSFAGQTVDSSSVLIKYTYFGDTNLDGQVDVIDLGNLATAWQTSGVWANGDSNYDGFVDVIDLGQLATNWQAGVGSPLGPGSLDQALAAYGLPSVSVPEPAAAVALAGLLSLVRVRGRRKLKRSAAVSRTLPHAALAAGDFAGR